MVSKGERKLMKKRTIFLVVILVFFASCWSYSQEYLSEGLFFSSHEVTQEKRTSLNLTPENPLHFEKEFVLEFEAKFRDKDGYFGNIVKIIGDNEINYSLVGNTNYTNISSEEANFWLVENDSILMRFEWSDIPNGGLNKWMNFKVHFDIINSKIVLTINGERNVKKAKVLDKLKDFNMVFGKVDSNNAHTTDVAPMSLKQVKIADNNVLIRNWSLGKHTRSNKVYDEISNDVALVDNPKWLLDKHAQWGKNKDFQFDNLLGTAEDIPGERIFFINDKAVYVYSLKNQVIDTLIYDGSPYPCSDNTFIYNPYLNELWSYSFDKNMLSKFDFSTLKWTLDDIECPEPEFWHHSKLISPVDSSLIAYGGYGFFNYNSDIKNFKNKLSRWENIDKTQSIDPRHRSSSGVLGENSFLIYGGLGSKSGRQVANTRHYYDLYSVSLHDFSVEKLWGKESLLSTPTVPVESMVLNSSLDAFYTLIYDSTNSNSSLKLARFGIEDYGMTIFPDSIPYKQSDTESSTIFFLDKSRTKLYAFITTGDDVSIHSLSYPPLLSSEIFQEEPKISNSYKYAWILASLAVIGGLFFLIKKWLKKEKSYKGEDYDVLGKEEQQPKFSFEKREKSSIYVFGGFQAYDKGGNDVTALFTPTLKQLFILILLYQSKNEKGISSTKLTELLWYDKIGTSARNNRNVNISKLRILLEKIGDVQLGHDNTYWTIILGKEVFCDYEYAKKQLRLFTADSTEEEVYKFLRTVSAGEICPDIQTEWMDVFKVDIENKLIDGLERLSKTQGNPNLLILIAETILKYAPLNEEALSLKCRSLYSLGKKGMAKKSYDSFCKEYTAILDTKFDVPFNSIVS